jgi:hypothetical protein
MVNEQMLVSKDTGFQREFSVSSGVDNVVRLKMVIYNTAGIGRNINADAVQVAQWNFVACRHVASTGVTTVRCNTTTGSYTRTGSPVEEWASHTVPWEIGRVGFFGGILYLTGYVDECAKWSRALSDGELDTLYNSGAGIDLRQ